MQIGRLITESPDLLVLNAELLCSFDRDLAELFEVLHETESSLAGASAGSFVTLYDLSLSVLCELSEFSVDFFNKCFHDKIVLLMC